MWHLLPGEENLKETVAPLSGASHLMVEVEVRIAPKALASWVVKWTFEMERAHRPTPIGVEAQSPAKRGALGKASDSSPGERQLGVGGGPRGLEVGRICGSTHVKRVPKPPGTAFPFKSFLQQISKGDTPS